MGKVGLGLGLGVVVKMGNLGVVGSRFGWVNLLVSFLIICFILKEKDIKCYDKKTLFFDKREALYG